MLIARTKEHTDGLEVHLSQKDQRLLISCGIDPKDIEPNLFGKGVHHRVYKFRDGSKVVKIPKLSKLGLISSADQERRDINLYQEYFGEYSVPTILHESSIGYCVTMDFIEGKQLSTEDVFEQSNSRRNVKMLTPIGNKLVDLVSCGKSLAEKEGLLIDFMGSDGLIDMLGGAKLGNRPVRLGNILISNGSLRLVDYDLISIQRKGSSISVIKNRAALGLNRFTLMSNFNQAYL